MDLFTGPLAPLEPLATILLTLLASVTFPIALLFNSLSITNTYLSSLFERIIVNRADDIATIVVDIGFAAVVLFTIYQIFAPVVRGALWVLGWILEGIKVACDVVDSMFDGLERWVGDMKSVRFAVEWVGFIAEKTGKKVKEMGRAFNRGLILAVRKTGIDTATRTVIERLQIAGVRLNSASKTWATKKWEVLCKWNIVQWILSIYRSTKNSPKILTSKIRGAYEGTTNFVNNIHKICRDNSNSILTTYSTIHNYTSKSCSNIYDTTIVSVNEFAEEICQDFLFLSRIITGLTTPFLSSPYEYLASKVNQMRHRYLPNLNIDVDINVPKIMEEYGLDEQFPGAFEKISSSPWGRMRSRNVFENSLRKDQTVTGQPVTGDKVDDGNRIKEGGNENRMQVGDKEDRKVEPKTPSPIESRKYREKQLEISRLAVDRWIQRSKEERGRK